MWFACAVGTLPRPGACASRLSASIWFSSVFSCTLARSIETVWCFQRRLRSREEQCLAPEITLRDVRLLPRASLSHRLSEMDDLDFGGAWLEVSWSMLSELPSGRFDLRVPRIVSFF